MAIATDDAKVAFPPRWRAVTPINVLIADAVMNVGWLALILEKLQRHRTVQSLDLDYTVGIFKWPTKHCVNRSIPGNEKSMQDTLKSATMAKIGPPRYYAV